MTAVAAAPTARSQLGLSDIHRRNALRLIPLLVAGYVLNTLAKTNIGFAALEMNRQLGLTPQVFGLGAGLFFVSYTLFEIPSNLLMRRFGARLWLSRILILWGLAAMAMALTSGKWSFYALRLLLGLAEAGWYPGVIVYLALWFPRRFRARSTMLFSLAIPVSAVFGNPLSGAILSLPTLFGLKSWQWLFILEGLPSVFLGLFALRWLRDRPEDASWLQDDEKRALTDSLREDQSAARPAAGAPRDPALAIRLPIYCLVNFGNATGLYATFLWLPHVVKQLGSLSNFQTGLVSGAPFALSAAALVACAWSSDRLGERKWHNAIMLMVGGAAMAAITVSPSPLFSLLLLSLALAGAIGVQGSLFAMFAEGLDRARGHGASLAAGIAAVTTIGNLGGFVGATVIGRLMGAGGGFGSALLLIAVAFGGAGLLIALARRRWIVAEPS